MNVIASKDWLRSQVLTRFAFGYWCFGGTCAYTGKVGIARNEFWNSSEHVSFEGKKANGLTDKSLSRHALSQYGWILTFRQIEQSLSLSWYSNLPLLQTMQILGLLVDEIWTGLGRLGFVVEIEAMLMRRNARSGVESSIGHRAGTGS